MYRVVSNTALAAGVDVTHLDAHMGAVNMPEFVDIYLRLGRAYKVPILLVKDLVRCNPAQYSEPLTTQRYNAIVAEAREDGFPIFEILLETPWHRVSDPESAYREIFGSISDGLTFLAFNFNTPGDFEAIEPEYAHIRTEEYALFKTPQIARWLLDYGLESVGFREIRDSLRSHWTDRSIDSALPLPVRGGYRFGALVMMLCILCRNRVRDLGAQPFTDPGTDLQNQIQVAEFMPEIA